MQTSSDSEELHLEEWSRATDSTAVAHSRPWLWLAAAGALLPFANGANNISLAAWLAPVFLLRLVRRESPKVGLLVAYVLQVAAFAFQFRGMVPIPGMGYYIFLFAWGRADGVFGVSSCVGRHRVRAVAKPIRELGTGGLFTIRELSLTPGSFGDRVVGHHFSNGLVRSGVQLDLRRRTRFQARACRSLGVHRNDRDGDAAGRCETGAEFTIFTNSAGRFDIPERSGDAAKPGNHGPHLVRQR